MRDSKIVRILQSLSKEELKAFGNFVKSPFFNRSRNTNELFKYIIRYRPKYTSSKLDREEVFKHLFPGKDFNDSTLQNVISELTRFARFFLVMLTIEEKGTDFQLLLSQAYLNKNLTEDSVKLNKKIREELKLTFSYERDYVSQLKRLINNEYKIYAKNNNYINILKNSEELFHAIARQFIFEYFLFRSNHELFTSARELPVFESQFLESLKTVFAPEKINTIVEGFKDEKDNYIQLHYFRFKTIIEPDEIRHYDSLEDLFIKNVENLDWEEKSLFFVHFQNYCIRKQLNGNFAFTKKLIEIYKLMLEHKCYSTSREQSIDPILFRNIVLMCLFNKEVDFIFLMAKEYSNYLNSDDRDNFRNYAYAHYWYLKKDFNSALRYIKKISGKQILELSIDIKNLSLKVYYELDLEEARKSVDAYKRFLKNSTELQDEHKVIYQTFVDFYYELLNIKSKVSDNDPEDLKSRIQKFAFKNFVPWFVEKIDELIKTKIS